LSVDKLPGALWMQALSARVFGVHTWSLILPQVVAGALTVLFLFRAVRRVAGAPAGLIAAVLLAVSPAFVALSRGNIPDSWMILLRRSSGAAVCSAGPVLRRRYAEAPDRRTGRGAHIQIRRWARR
jgi:hypothetical protein